MLLKAPELIDGMIEIAYQRRWLQTTLATIRFQQCVTQALWTNDSPLLQLPHMDEDTARQLAKGGRQSRCLADYLRVPDKDKKGLSALSEEQRTDLLRACALFPHLGISTKLFVEEDEDGLLDEGEERPEIPEDAIRGDQILENDLVTLRVTLTRENVAEGEDAPPVHAPLFPSTIKEGWWLILTDMPKDDPKREAEATIHAIERVGEQRRVVQHDLRFMAPPQAGRYSLLLRVVSDCYMGVDEEAEITFDVRPAAELPAYKPHPEDVELDNEPTLFEQVMTGEAEDSSDEEEEDENAPAVTEADLKRSAVRAMTSPVQMDEDSEDDD